MFVSRTESLEFMETGTHEYFRTGIGTWKLNTTLQEGLMVGLSFLYYQYFIKSTITAMQSQAFNISEAAMKG
jgi:hypothetical protein